MQRRRRAATGTAMAAAAALAMANLSTFCCVEGFVSPAGLRPVGANLLGIHRSGCHHRDCQQRSKWTSTPKSNSKLRATSQQYPLYTSIDSSENLAVPAGGGGGSAARPPKSSAVLSPGDVIEFWHAKSLMFGNYCGLVKGRRSLAVRAASGESLVIDAGQIVGLWPQGGGASPSTPTEWADVRKGVRALLQSMPTRGLDLAPFWKAASSSGKGCVVTPGHVAEFLFSEEYRSIGLRKRKPFEFHSAGMAFQPSAVERAAAAQLLAGEQNRFKRVVSERTDKINKSSPSFGADAGAPPPPSTLKNSPLVIDVAGQVGQAQSGTKRQTGESGPGTDRLDLMLGNQGDGEGSQTVMVRLGGFKAVDQSVAVTREVADFCRVIKAMKQAKRANVPQEGDEGLRAVVGSEGALERAGLFEPAFLLILHSLEAYAIGGDNKALAPQARRVLETLGKANPAAAKDVLVDVGLWTSKPPPSPTSRPSPSASRAVDGVVAHDGDDVEGIELPAEAGGVSGAVIPWPAEVLEAAGALGTERERRWQTYAKRPPQQDKVGAPAPFGRHDFRAAKFGVYCIDGERTSFQDDAFSIDPDTREVFIHITDVQGLVPQGTTLDEVARLRAASEYLPQGPLFMMPPTALRAMSFSDQGPNEAVTVGVKLDLKTGAIVSSRVMLTTLPPAVPLTFSQVDRLLEEADTTKKGDRGSKSRVTAELKALEYVSRRSAEASGRRDRSREGVQLRNSRGVEVRMTEVPKSRSLSLVDELLTVYTLEVYDLCRKAGVAMPTLVGQQDLVAAGKSRYGTGPLRRYVDILAQRQITAVLRGSGYLGKKYLLATASYLTWRQNETRTRRQEETGRLSLEALASHCRTQMKATGMPHAVVPARGTGQGREVRLDGLGVTVHVKRAPGMGGRGVAIAKGVPVKVVIERVEPQLKQVVATEYAG